MEAPRTRLSGLEAPKYTPSLLEIEADLRVIVEEPLGSLLLVGMEKISLAEVACFMKRRTTVEGVTFTNLRQD
jgi:hypothetical protein